MLEVAKALADANRLRLLNVLRRGELCACQLTELIGLAPSTMSRHLAVLTRAGLVTARKEGRWMHFRLAGPDAPAVVREALEWVARGMAGSARAAGDAVRLREILEEDPTELCRRQCRR